MHEMGIAISIRDIVLESLPKEEGIRVGAIRIVAGRLTAIVPPSLELCMKAVGEGTPLEGARLDLVVVPVRIQCRSCEAVGEIEKPPFLCSECRSTDVSLISGREMFVESIEIAES